jgi:hypothetical protein
MTFPEKQAKNELVVLDLDTLFASVLTFSVWVPKLSRSVEIQRQITTESAGGLWRLHRVEFTSTQ